MSIIESIGKAINYAKSIIDIGSRFIPATSNDEGRVGRSRSEITEDKLREAAEQIKNSIKDATEAIIDKIESDKLEELNAKVKNISFILKFEQQSDILHYILLAKESIDYAENRIKEGKRHWIGPTLIAKSAVLAVMQQRAINADGERLELVEACKQAKREVLDMIVPEIIFSGRKVPWQSVEMFLSDGSSGIPAALLEEDRKNDFKQASGELKAQACGIIKWAVSTGSKVNKGGLIAIIFGPDVGGLDVKERIFAKWSMVVDEIVKKNGCSLIRPGEVIARVSPLI